MYVSVFVCFFWYPAGSAGTAGTAASPAVDPFAAMFGGAGASAGVGGAGAQPNPFAAMFGGAGAGVGSAGAQPNPFAAMFGGAGAGTGAGVGTGAGASAQPNPFAAMFGGAQPPVAGNPFAAMGMGGAGNMQQIGQMMSNPMVQQMMQQVWAFFLIPTIAYEFDHFFFFGLGCFKSGFIQPSNVAAGPCLSPQVLVLYRFNLRLCCVCILYFPLRSWP
jgi:hypothetical protein